MIRLKGQVVGATAACLVLAVLTACASTSTAPATAPSGDFVMMWPEPPLTPRIKFERTLSSEADLGRESSFGESLGRWLTGSRPPLDHVFQPMDIAVSDDGDRVYISDFAQGRLHLFDFAASTVTPVFPGRAMEMPFGVAIDADETLYVVEQRLGQVTVMKPTGDVLRVITHPAMIRPADIAIDRQRGLLYVADPSRQAEPRHSVKVFDLQGNLVREIGKGRGFCPGCLQFPTYVEVDADGAVYVANTVNARVEVFGPDGEYLRTIGERGDVFGTFDKPKGIAVDTFGNTYVVDSGWSNVQIFNPKGDVLLYFGGRGTFPGLLHNPTGIAIDRQNRIYVADYLNYRVSEYQLINTSADDSFLDPEGDITSSSGADETPAGPAEEAAPDGQDLEPTSSQEGGQA